MAKTTSRIDRRSEEGKIDEEVHGLLLQAAVASRFDARRAVDITGEALALARSKRRRRSVALCYADLGAFHRQLFEYQIAIKYLSRALALEEEFPEEPSPRTYIHYNIGLIHEAWGDPARALEYYRVSVDWARRARQLNRAVAALTAIGNVCRTLGEYEQGMKALVESLEICEEVDYVYGRAVSRTTIGLLYADLGQWKNALESLREGLRLHREVGSVSGEALATANIGNCCLQIGDLAAAEGYLTSALRLGRAAGDVGSEIAVLINLGLVDVKRGNLDAALRRFGEALTLTESVGIEYYRPKALAAAADVYYRMDRFQDACEQALAGLQCSAATGYDGEQPMLHLTLARAYEKLGELERALEHYRQYAFLCEQRNDPRTLLSVEAAESASRVERVGREREDYHAMKMAVSEKIREATGLALELSRKERLVEQLRTQVKAFEEGQEGEVRELAESLLQWIQGEEMSHMGKEAFERHLRQFHPGFLRNLSLRYPSLTPTELKICMLLRMNMSSKDISSVLNIALYTTNTHRRNIRIKLGLAGSVNLTTFMTGL